MRGGGEVQRWQVQMRVVVLLWGGGGSVLLCG